MTRIEFNEFVAQELRGRWPKWDPTEAMLGDWWSLLRYHSVDVARSVVQEHRISEKARVFEPLIGVVARALRNRRRGPVAEIVRYDPWIRCLEAPADHPDWAGQEWVRLDAFRRSCAADKAYVVQYAGDVAAIVQQREGGRWCGVCRPDGQIPQGQPELHGQEAQDWAIEHIRNGPDGPGRRWLKSRQPVLMSAAEAPRPKYADQNAIEKLLEPLTKPGAGGPTAEFDLPMNPSED